MPHFTSTSAFYGFFAAVALSPALLASPATAQTAENESATQDAPSPAAPPLIVEVRGHEATVHSEPALTRPRRGVVSRDSRYRVLASQDGEGCFGPWYQIYADAWICSRDVRAVDSTGPGRRLPNLSPGEIVPWPYAFVREPTLEYRLKLGILEEQRELLPGFGFAVEGRVTYEGTRYLRSAEGTLVPAGAAGITSRISEFAGIVLTQEATDEERVGWINPRSAWVYDKPELKKSARVESLPRYTTVRVSTQQKTGKSVFVKLGEDRWMDRRDLRLMGPAPLPSDVAPGEKWIDVDVQEQVLTAYEGQRPVFTTMVSSGRRGRSATVKGEYRIWAKVAAIAMDNTDEELEETQADIYAATTAELPEGQHLYSLRHVPWTQFFFESYALHGVYWHDRFGNRRSHGCVNLAPKDAKWLYDWTSPSVPEGFWSIHSTPNDKGTLVRIR